MMDLWAVQVKGCNSLGLRSHHHWILGKRCSFAQVGVLEISALKRKSSFTPPHHHGFRSVGVVKTMAKKNNNNNNDDDDDDNDKSSSSGNGDRSVPEGNGSKGDGPFEESNDTASQMSRLVNMDWREFRAQMFAWEKQAEKAESNAHNQGETGQESKPLGLKWAHPIAVPENGCVLVATEKIDGLCSFGRTVVLLLSTGTKHPPEGPYGIVINRPHNKKIKHTKPANVELATTFADCSLYFGGPLEAGIFLLKTEKKSKLPGFEEVIPGLCFGSINSVDEAAALVKKGVLKPQDFRFFVGYASWHLDQLREEIESNFWFVAACSSNLIFGASESSSENLWEEILQLMGGRYSDLSRKPKQDM